MVERGVERRLVVSFARAGLKPTRDTFVLISGFLFSDIYLLIAPQRRSIFDSLPVLVWRRQARIRALLGTALCHKRRGRAGHDCGWLAGISARTVFLLFFQTPWAADGWARWDAPSKHSLHHLHHGVGWMDGQHRGGKHIGIGGRDQVLNCLPGVFWLAFILSFW